MSYVNQTHRGPKSFIENKEIDEEMLKRVQYLLDIGLSYKRICEEEKISYHKLKSIEKYLKSTPLNQIF